MKCYGAFPAIECGELHCQVRGCAILVAARATDEEILLAKRGLYRDALVEDLKEWAEAFRVVAGKYEQREMVKSYAMDIEKLLK